MKVYEATKRRLELAETRIHESITPNDIIVSFLFWFGLVWLIPPHTPLFLWMNLAVVSLYTATRHVSAYVRFSKREEGEASGVRRQASDVWVQGKRLRTSWSHESWQWKERCSAKAMPETTVRSDLIQVLSYLMICCSHFSS